MAVRSISYQTTCKPVLAPGRSSHWAHHFPHHWFQSEPIPAGLQRTFVNSVRVSQCTRRPLSRGSNAYMYRAGNNCKQCHMQCQFATYVHCIALVFTSIYGIQVTLVSDGPWYLQQVSSLISAKGQLAMCYSGSQIPNYGCQMLFCTLTSPIQRL